MEINTKYHGIRKYEEKDIITISSGIPGFDNLKKFIMFPVEDNDVFNVLQSIENQEIGLIVTSPFIVKKDYELDIDDNTINELKINKPSDVVVLTTVTINSDIKKITTNLLAPIIININENIGKQIILNKDNSLIKYNLFKEEA